MSDTIDPDSQATPAAGAAGASGCVIFLIDESAAMDARVAGGTKSKAASIATAVNSLLNQLTAGPAIDVSIVGCRTHSHGGQDIGPRWGGSLAGREFVESGELAGAPLSVETRVRKVPGSGGIGVAREETVRFPVWYVPSLGGTASRTAAFEHCRGMLSSWFAAARANPKRAMIISFIGEMSPQETPQALGKAVQEFETPGGLPLVVHTHLSSSDRVPATLYPSGDAHLPPGPIRTLFQASSVLPQEFCASLRQLQVTVNAGARGLIYNAKMVDLIRLLSLVKSYAQYRPPAGAAPAATPTESTASGVPVADMSTTTAPVGDATVTDGSATPAPSAECPAPDSPTVEMPAFDAATVQLSAASVAAAVAAGNVPAEEAPAPSAAEADSSAAGERAVVVLLLDRSVDDPTGEKEKSVWRRIEEHANELLGRIAKRGKGRVDSAVVSYGTDAGGHTVVETTFSGPLAGRTVVGDTDLAGGALRVEEVTEQVSNGIGGLVSVTRKRPVFVDLKPTAAAAPAPGFAAVNELLEGLQRDRAESPVLPVVLHITRGRFEPGQIEEAVGRLNKAGRCTLYHLVLSESPHPSLAYPAEPTKIQDAGLVKLWELTSPLLGSRTLAARKTAILPESRGIVINGKFDLLLDGIEEALVAPEAGTWGANGGES